MGGLGLGVSHIFSPCVLFSGAGNWWEAGGAPTPLAAYQPKGAASLAASYVNLANPGTYDAAVGVAPTHASATGWTFDGSTQYLTTGIVGHNQGWSFCARYSSALGSGMLLGSLENFRYWGVRVTYGRAFYGSSFTDRGEMPAAGVYCYAGVERYLDGVTDGAFSSESFTGTTVLEIGRANGIATLYYSGNVQAVAIYNVTLTALQVAAVSVAMAAL